MESKRESFKNIERGRLKKQFYFSAVKYAYAIFALCFLIFYLNISLLTLALVVLAVALCYIRFNYYQILEEEMDILAIEIGLQFFVLSCVKKDYQINYSKIEFVEIKPDEQLQEYKFLVRLKKGEQLEWPKTLREGSSLKIPGVFEDDLFLIMSKSKTLSSLCKNYEEAKSLLQYEKDLRFIED